MYATGGFTHFIGDDEPAGKSVARWANLLPTGRASQKDLNVSHSSSRDSRDRWAIKSGHAVGQPSVSTSSRGREKGKSKAPSHGPGRCSQASKASKSCREVRLCSW